VVIAGLGERQVAEFVEDDDIGVYEPVGGLAGPAMGLFVLQLVDKFDGREAAHPQVVVRDRLHADGGRQVSLAGARRDRDRSGSGSSPWSLSYRMVATIASACMAGLPQVIVAVDVGVRLFAQGQPGGDLGRRRGIGGEERAPAIEKVLYIASAQEPQFPLKSR
jgi:hypothetical protein